MVTVTVLITGSFFLFSFFFCFFLKHWLDIACYCLCDVRSWLFYWTFQTNVLSSSSFLSFDTILCISTIMIFTNNKYGISLQVNCRHSMMTRTADWLYFVLFVGSGALTHSFHWFCMFPVTSFCQTNLFPHSERMMFTSPVCYYSTNV